MIQVNSSNRLSSLEQTQADCVTFNTVGLIKSYFEGFKAQRVGEDRGDNWWQRQQ